jgi:hypothetical protein
VIACHLLCPALKPVIYTILKNTADYHLDLASSSDWVRSDWEIAFSGTEILLGCTKTESGEVESGPGERGARRHQRRRQDAYNPQKRKETPHRSPPRPDRRGEANRRRSRHCRPSLREGTSLWSLAPRGSRTFAERRTTMGVSWSKGRHWPGSGWTGIGVAVRAWPPGVPAHHGLGTTGGPCYAEIRGESGS